MVLLHSGFLQVGLKLGQVGLMLASSWLEVGLFYLFLVRLVGGPSSAPTDKRSAIEMYSWLGSVWVGRAVSSARPLDKFQANDTHLC